MREQHASRDSPPLAINDERPARSPRLLDVSTPRPCSRRGHRRRRYHLGTDGSSRTAGAGRLLAKAAGVISGLDVAGEVFRRVDPAITFTQLVADGDVVAAMTPIATVEDRRATCSPRSASP